MTSASSSRARWHGASRQGSSGPTLESCFWASLIPFATAYVAETRLDRFPTAVYAGLQCVCAIAFNVMFRTIVVQRDDEAIRLRARIRRRQNNIAVAVYAASAVVALLSPILAILL